MRKRSIDSRIGLYRPGMSSPFRRKQITVGRQAILDDTLNHLRSAADRKSKHHFLFLGPRGIGKSHFLAIIEDGIHEDPRLASRMVVARFPEESIGTLSFSDLLKQLVSILAERITEEPHWKDMDSKLKQLHDSNDVVDMVVPVLRRTNEAKKRTIVVMIENLHELFSKQIRLEPQIGAIRKFFMDKNGCLLIATAPMHFDAVTDVAQPFYDFFDTQRLQPFDKEQSVTLLRQMRDLDSTEDAKIAKEMSHCVMALHDMTGGNPRLMVMTCELIVHEGFESAKEILLRLVDSISPTYQASLSEMAPQERALLETLASMRDATPKTPANIASRMGISERQTSALLKRLTDARLVTFEINPIDKRSRTYCIRDGFLDIWLAMQAGDTSKKRLCRLSETLESFYDKKDGPYLQSGMPNRAFLSGEWPPTTFDFQDVEQSTYLAFIHAQISLWTRSRQGEIEELSLEIRRHGRGLSENLVARSLIVKINDSPAKTYDLIVCIKSRLKLAYLYFLLNKDEDCLRELAMVMNSEVEATEELKAMANKNIAYTRAQIPKSKNRIIPTSNIYISYAWGDDSPSGKQRQDAVNLLCSTLTAEGIPFHRDKDQSSAGDSIHGFMERLTKGDRIIAIISEKYLLGSEYCVLFELFRAFRRKGFSPLEFQELVIPVILDDGKKYIDSRDGRIEVAEYWQSLAIKQKERINGVDPRATSISEHTAVNDMADMVERIPDMLAALNDVGIPRFADLAKSNFSEVINILRKAEPSNVAIDPVDSVDQKSRQDLADQVGGNLAKQLEDATLYAQTKLIPDLYSQGRNWLEVGGVHASPFVRRRLLVSLANAILLDSEERRIPDHDLDDALGLLDLADRERFDDDLELDALTVATRLFVDHLLGDDSKSLDALREIDHPIAFANRVRLLFLRGLVDEAFELVHHNKLHVRWAEIAAAIYARLGRISDAIEICQSMRIGGVDGADDPNLVTIRYFRCLMIVADEFFRRAFLDRNVGDRLYLALLNESERKQLTELLDILSPIISKVFGAGRISNGIERQSLEIALKASHLIGDQERASRIAKLLASASPISRQVPLAIHAGYITADIDILNRLQTDWPNNLDVSVSVCELAAIHLSDSKFALSKLDALTKSKLNEEQVSGLATVLLSVYQLESGELKNKAFSLLAGLVGADHFLLRMTEAVSAMDKKEWSVAERLLNERSAPDDPEWLSLHATVLQRKGDLQSSLADLKKLCSMTSSPSVLRQSVTVALKIEPSETEFAVKTLERLSRFPNERRDAEGKLAEIYFGSGTDDGLQRAAVLYEKLYRDPPNDPVLAKNAAICLRRLREIDHAISLLEELECDHPTFMDGFLLHAELLETQTRSEDAFALLDSESVRTRFWNELDFLHKYMHLGYVTDHELEAHLAMSQIREIEDGLPEEEKTLQAKNLHQVVDFFQGRRKFSEQVDEMIVRGQAPWTMRPFEEYSPIISAWAYRTQKLVPWETLAGRAQFSTYTSNAFYSQEVDAGERELVAIEASKSGESVVADISALITLFKLGLLEKSADYFGTVYVPSTYRELELFEAKRLQPHQLSRVEQSHRLFEMLVRGQLRRPSADLDEEVIDFQTDPDTKSFTIGDVALCLKKNGHISNERYKELVAGQSFILTGRQGIESILVSNRCSFTLFAIQTLDSAKLLDTLVELYRVTLTADSIHELEQEQFSFELQTRTARESREFWRIIRDNSKFQFASEISGRAKPESDKEAGESEIRESFRLALSAFDLAKERGLPLLADDRVLLTIAQNESDGRACFAFSTLELLSSLKNHGALSQEERLQHSLRLIDWRYRFLKIDDQLLMQAANLALESGCMPGIHLKKIARYVQDCMLDVGLFGGNENVTPPRSMALELYAYWTKIVARFVNQLWTDDSVTDQTAESITRWAIDNLLPTVPAVIRADVQIALADNQAKLVLVHILSDRGANPNTSRSGKLMSILQEALQMPQSEFCRTIFSLVELDDIGEGTGLSEEKWSQVQQVFRRGIAKHALAQFHHDGGYQVEARGIALLEASKSLRKKIADQDVPAHILDVLKDITSEQFLKIVPPGPLVFHREPDEKGSSAFEASDLLIHPNSASREAVVSYFSQLAIRSKNTMSERLLKALQTQSKRIFQKRAVNWYPAAEDLMEAIENDWDLNIAGFRQVLHTKNQEWIHRYWYRCVRPRFHPANTLPVTSFHACTDPGSMKERVLPEILINAEKDGIVEAYCVQLGHLPLVGDWSLSDFIHRNSSDKVSTNELLQLAEHHNYLYAYHGCIALVAKWEYLEKDEQIRAAQLLSDFICLSRNEELTSRRGRFWACLKRLANYFLAWIPLYGPELGDDNSASLAWWMAERLTEAINENVESKKDPKAHVEFVLERNIEPLVHTGFEISQLIRGGATSSVFHVNTNFVQLGGPYFVTLITSFGHHFASIYSLLNEKATSEIDNWMLANAVHLPVGLPQQGSVVFTTYKSDSQLTTEQWENAFKADEETRATFSQLREDCMFLTDENYLETLFSDFGSLRVEDQDMWLDRLKAAVWRKELPLNTILGLLRNPARCSTFVRSLKLEQLSSAIEMMLSIHQFGGDVWKHELPHRLVEWLDHTESLEAKTIVLNGIVCSAIAGEAPAALERVRERDDIIQLINAFRFQEERIESARCIVPRWTWSKLRVILDRLRVV